MQPKPWRERIRNFTPSWYAVCMGIGVQISLFHLFPYDGGRRDILDGFATAFLILNILVFISMTVTTIIRYIMFPETWGLMLNHPVQSLFIGCFPMALATIINGLVLLAYQRYRIAGTGFMYFIWGLWWTDVALSLTSNLGVFYMMITRHKYDTSTTFPGWLLPIVPTIVAGSTGCLVADGLAPTLPQHAYLTTLVSGCLLSMGLTMSLAILVLYIQRLILHGFPKAGTAVSVFLPLGPLGQGGYGLLLLGNLLVELLPGATSKENYLSTDGVSTAISAILFIFSVVLWVFGIWFLVPAALCLLKADRLAFSISWWGLIFPTGVYAVLTLTLAKKFHSPFLDVVGCVYTVTIFAMFTTVGVRTLLALRGGKAFHAPCLDELIVSKEGRVWRMGKGDVEATVTGNQSDGSATRLD